MKGGIGDDAVLDYVVFQISSTQNSYEALACSKDKIETIASGPLDQLALHLPRAKGCESNPSNNSFRLQPAESQNGSSWFTKFTLTMFLHIVNVPEMLKAGNAIEVEMSQLEETRKFHLTLYAKGPDQSADGTADTGSMEKAGLNQIKVETASSDATKNELLRALDLRLMALKEKLAASFDQAAGSTCSMQEISDLAEFTQHFGATDLRNFLLKILTLCPKKCPSDLSIDQSTSSHDLSNNSETVMREVCQPDVKPVTNSVSPAKIAQAERQSLSESDESSQSSEEDHSCAERSRPLIRSASPRRSASPMRRIQIGRSGSRRSTPLTIKSLSYFPARERAPIFRDADGTNSGDEEPVEQPPKKPEATVKRMSVQDAINLFERKQKDQNVDLQKSKASGEVSNATTSKSVLRRWSAGMGDSFTQRSHENASDNGPQSTSNELAQEGYDSKPAEVTIESSNPVGGCQVDASTEAEVTALPMDNPAELIMPKAEEVSDRGTSSSAEWSRQKEAELNLMLMKMMESKPDKHQGTNGGGGGGRQDTSSEQRGGFYSQYKEKRDEKLRAENAGKRAAKEAHIKVMKESLAQSKAEMVSKTGGVAGKRDSPNQAQRPRRNSSPPVLPKKEVSKPNGTRKPSLKTSPLPATRNSWSAGSLPRTNATAATKSSPGMVPSNSTPSRRKAQTTPSPTQPSLKTERSAQQPKGKKGTPADVKQSAKGEDEKKQRAAAKMSKSVKTKSPVASADDSRVPLAKPSFYSKVTKKSSVVPLESKPFLRKGTGIGPGVGPVVAKTKVLQSDDSSKNSENLVQVEENESSAMTAESTTKVLEDALLQPANGVNVNLETPLDNDINHETTEHFDESSVELVDSFENAVPLPVPEIQPYEDLGISSSAWVEVEGQEASASCDNGLPELAVSPGIAPAAAISSPRVRHSLSQMLQADNNEPEIIEWGNAENPPSLVYQKDAPKGLKRLLKFTRKSKGEPNVTGWASPSVFSEGEDDSEDTKAASKRSSDALLRKAAVQARGYEPPKKMLSGSFDTGNSSKRSTDYRGAQDTLSAQSSTSTISDKLREGQIASSATSTKATRSFFSLSTFRSNKSSESKLR